MPEYPFQSPAGEVRHVFYTMAEVPSIGATVEIDGEQWTRLPSESHVGVEPFRSRYPIESDSLPPTTPGCKLSPRGRPIVRSREHAKEICERTGLWLAD